MSIRLKVVVFASVFFIVTVFFVVLPWVHAFLSKNQFVPAKTLVVQGWIFDTMMDQATAEFRRGNYERIIVTGSGQYAENGRIRLIKRGVDSSLIVIAPAKVIEAGKHRTFSEAYGLRKYILENAPEIHAVNIVTSSVHGKKTLTIFGKVLGKSVDVGVVTCRSNYYNADRLWCSPLGIKVTLKFFIGYLYALVWNVREE